MYASLGLNELLQDHSQYNCIRPLGSYPQLAYVNLTSPPFLTTSPHKLYICSERSILNIKHTFLILWCEMTGDRSGFHWLQFATLEKMDSQQNICDIKTSAVFVRTFFNQKWGRLIRGVRPMEALFEGLSVPCRPDQWCVKWQWGSCNRVVLHMQISIQPEMTISSKWQHSLPSFPVLRATALPMKQLSSH